MHLIIDGYNLLHIGRSFAPRTSEELRRQRDQLLDQLAAFRQLRHCEMTVVFDGWQSGGTSEKKERWRGIEVIFSRLGEKADEVIKRLVRTRGSGAVVVTSDREVARYAQGMAAAVIPSDQFSQKKAMSAPRVEKGADLEEEEGSGRKKKGPARRLSKKEKKLRAALKKL